MATLSHFQSFIFSLSPHKLSAFRSPSLNADQQQQQLFHEHPPPKHFAICASSIKKPRASRKVRSDADLCNDLRQFISAEGLPEGHVPSMKELSQHGRKDLANIVRRRGYKFIRELLGNSTITETDGSNTEGSLIGKLDATSDCEDEPTGQDEKVNDLVEHVRLSTEVLIIDNSTNTDPALNSDYQSHMSIESSTNPSLQEKVAKFIQNGELDTFEDNGHCILNENGTEGVNTYIELENAVEIESKSLGEDCSEHVPTRSNAAMMLNGSTLTSELSPPPVTGNKPLSRDDYSSTEGLVGANSDTDLEVETSERENQVEINHLKFMLHQKELELSRLKEQIEKEKLTLSTLQTKAETEISKAQKLISEKDSELHAAEENLLGLEEVQIQYCGDGETVEVAGSFNGWHHQIKMDPQPSPSTIDPIGSRKPRLWSTVLWLYPGIYEIKFIVDGHWRIDPQRESITRGTIHNNILQVDR